MHKADEILTELQGSEYYSIRDMRSGFWQINVAPEDIEKTACITPKGLYEWLVMPFGFCSLRPRKQHLLAVTSRHFLTASNQKTNVSRENVPYRRDSLASNSQIDDSQQVPLHGTGSGNARQNTKKQNKRRKRNSTETNSTPSTGKKRKKSGTRKRKDTATKNRKSCGKEPFKIPYLEPLEQNHRYLGNLPQLRMFLIEKGYNKKRGAFAATKRWLKTKAAKKCLPSFILSGKYTVDHIIPKDIGGADWPYNYFIMPASVNSSFGETTGPHKWKYIGKAAEKTAKQFNKWIKEITSGSHVDFAQFQYQYIS
eukprot:g10221.t1